MEFHFPRRGQPVADHQWLARTVGIAKASGMWEAPQVPNPTCEGKGWGPVILCPINGSHFRISFRIRHLRGLPHSRRDESTTARKHEPTTPDQI